MEATANEATANEATANEAIAGEIVVVNKPVSVAEIPALVQQQTNTIIDLKAKIDAATQAAKTAADKAKSANNMSAGLFQKKGAIEGLQGAAVKMSDAQGTLLVAQTLSYQYQELLGKITQGLFALGVTNIAANRSVVQSLRLQLEGATPETLDALAQQEIQSVIDQLLAQQDLMLKQEELSRRLEATGTTLNVLTHASLAAQEKLNKNEGKLREHTLQLEQVHQIDATQDSVLAKQAEKDREHDRLLVERAEKDKAQDTVLAEIQVDDNRQDEALCRQAEVDKALQDRTEQLESRLNVVEEQANVLRQQYEALSVAKADKSYLPLLALLLGAASLIVSLLHILL